MAKKRPRPNRPNRPRRDPPDVRRPDEPAVDPVPLPEPRAKPGKPLPPPAPVFWFGFEVAWAKLVLARVVLFALLALDAFLQIRHAPRYGAGDFNVAQLPAARRARARARRLRASASSPAPYLFVLAALRRGDAARAADRGRALRVAVLRQPARLVPAPLPGRPPARDRVLRAVAAAAGCRARDAGADVGGAARSSSSSGSCTCGPRSRRSIRRGLDGRTLGGQLTGALRTAIDGTLGMQAASILVIGVELVLAATIWLRPAWRIAAPLGLAVPPRHRAERARDRAVRVPDARALRARAPRRVLRVARRHAPGALDPDGGPPAHPRDELDALGDRARRRPRDRRAGPPRARPVRRARRLRDPDRARRPRTPARPGTRHRGLGGAPRGPRAVARRGPGIVGGRRLLQVLGRLRSAGSATPRPPSTPTAG